MNKTQFLLATGRDADENEGDLSRANCQRPGGKREDWGNGTTGDGHTLCGVCAAHKRPVFACIECRELVAQGVEVERIPQQPTEVGYENGIGIQVRPPQ